MNLGEIEWEITKNDLVTDLEDRFPLGLLPTMCCHGNTKPTVLKPSNSNRFPYILSNCHWIWLNCLFSGGVMGKNLKDVVKYPFWCGLSQLMDVWEWDKRWIEMKTDWQCQWLEWNVTLDNWVYTEPSGNNFKTDTTLPWWSERYSR